MSPAAQVASYLDQVQRLLVAIAIVAETYDLDVDLADILEGIGDTADDLREIAAGRQPRDPDGLPSFFDKCAREYRERRGGAMPRRRRAA